MWYSWRSKSSAGSIDAGSSLGRSVIGNSPEMIEGLDRLVRFFRIFFLIEKVAIAQSVPHATKTLIAIPIFSARDKLGGGVVGLRTWESVVVESVAFGT